MAKKTVKGICAICGNEITGKMKTLATGETICEECYQESAEVVECEGCGKLFWAKGVIRIDADIHCLDCAKKVAEEIFADGFYPYELEPEDKDDDDILTLEAYIELPHEDIDTWEYGPKLKKIAHKLLDGMGWKEDVA